MITRIGVFGLALACVLAMLFLVVFQAKGADFDNDWLLEDLTCEELVAAHAFEVEVFQQIVESWHGCQAYYDCEDCNNEHGLLQCALIRKDGEFIQGIINDLVAVFDAKECLVRR